MRTRFDVIVIGAGENGLTAAAYLARAGRKVLVLERRDVIGGSNHLTELHPGFRVDGAFHRRGWLDPTMAAELDLEIAGGTAPETAVFAPDGDGGFVLPRSIPAAVEAVRRRSSWDAARWEEFCRLAHKLSGFLQTLYASTPPQLTSTRPADLMALLGLGGRVRGLGKADMIELLRILPMSVAELLDDWFETDVLKGTLGAGGITGIAQGPRSAGTAFVMLHHQVGSPAGVFRAGGVPGGAATLPAQLAAAATRVGAEIRTGAAVSRILVRDGCVAGAALADGEEVTAGQIVSTVDPRRTMLELVEPTELAPEYARAVQNIRARGVMAKVNLALSELPRFGGSGADERHLRGVISVSPTLDYLERAWDDAKHGGISRAPVLEAVIPSLADSALAPAGAHVMSVWMQYAPWRLRHGQWDAATREAVGDLVVDCLAEHAPNLPASVLARQVLTPKDLEEQYGASEGNLYQGEMGLDQVLFMRPVPGWGNHRTPIGGLYLGGSGTHPGGGIAGGAGRLAVREMSKPGSRQTESSR